MGEIILASASPRRSEILKLLDIPFKVKPASNECCLDLSLSLRDAVLKVARSKAEEVQRQYPNNIIIGADTIVSIDGQVLGKPKDKQHAFKMLSLLSGRVHTVITAVWICSPSHKIKGSGFTDRTLVKFYTLSESDINDYILTGEPMDKAGGYGIQGKGLSFIRSINGDFYSVMGLPGARLLQYLKIGKLLLSN